MLKMGLSFKIFKLLFCPIVVIYSVTLNHIHVEQSFELNMEGEPETKPEEKPPAAQEKGHKKGEPREKRPRPQRKNEYEFNAELIDENTVIPAAPKKAEILPKPDIKQFKEKELKNSHRIEDIINKKKQIRAEKFKFNRKTQGGDSKHQVLQNQFGDVQQLRDKMAELKVERNKLGDDLHNAIEKAKANGKNLQEYRGALKGSRQNFFEHLRELEHRQMTKQLSKGEEKDLNNEIMLLKRKVKDAESSGNIEIKLEQAEDLKDELDDLIAQIKKEKDPIDKEYNALKNELDQKNDHITGLKNEMTVEKNEKTEQKEKHDKEYDGWKEGKKLRLDKLENQFLKIKEENSKLWDQYHAKQDEYWKQKQFIDWVEWQNKVKLRKIGDKEREARRKEYEERDKQRQKDDKLQRFMGEIQLINFLINYLKGFGKDNEKTEEEAAKEIKLNQEEVAAKLAADAQWKKQKGLEVVQSKKQKEDEEPEKKYKKKGKRKQEVKKQEKFAIPYNVEAMFQRVKLVAPTSAQEIEKKIEELKERQALFERVAKEESTEEEKALADKIKEKDRKGKAKESEKGKGNNEDEFPSI